MATQTYLIKVDKSKITSDLSDFVIPIQINTHAGTSAFDIATPFFNQLGDYTYYENWENWNTGGSTALSEDSTWITVAGGLDDCTVIQATDPFAITSNIMKFNVAADGDGIYRWICSETGGVRNPMFNGSFDFWVKPTNPHGIGSDYIVFYFYLGSTASSDKLEFSINGTNFGYKNSSGSYITLKSSITTAWYHVRVDWRNNYSPAPARRARYWIKTATTAWDVGVDVNSGWVNPSHDFDLGIERFFTNQDIAGSDTVKAYYLEDIKVFNDYEQAFGTLAKKFKILTGAGEELPVEVVKFDSTTKTAYLFVKAKTISSISDSTLYLLIDNTFTDSTVIGSTTELSTHDVWPSDHKGVYHLDDDIAPAGSYIRDSTSNHNECVKQGSVSYLNSTEALVGNGFYLNGINDWLYIGHSGSLTFTTALTIVVAVRKYNDVSASFINKYGNGEAWNFFISDDRKIQVSFGNPTLGNPGYFGAITDTAIINDANTWYVLAFSFTAPSTLNIFVDGIIRPSTTYGTPLASIYNASGGPVTVGASGVGTQLEYVNGIFDEIRLIGAAKDAAWHKATYYSYIDQLYQISLYSQDGIGYVYPHSRENLFTLTIDASPTPSAFAINDPATNGLSTILTGLSSGATCRVLSVTSSTVYQCESLNYANFLDGEIIRDNATVPNSRDCAATYPRTTSPYLLPAASQGGIEMYPNLTVIPYIQAASAVSLGSSVVVHPFVEAEGAATLIKVIIPTLQAVGTYLTNSNAIGEITYNCSATGSVGGVLNAILPTIEAVDCHGGGQLNQSLPGLTFVGHGLRVTQGSLDKSLPALTMSDSYGSGYLNAELPKLTMEGTGIQGIVGSLDVNLPALIIATSGDAHGYTYINGHLDVVLPALSFVGTGTVVNTGHLNALLPAMYLQGRGSVNGINYLDKELPALTFEGTGRLESRGSLNATLPALEAENLHAIVGGRFDDYTLQYARYR